MSKPASQQQPEREAPIPTVRVGLRPDGCLCIVLPGLDAHGRTPPLNDKHLARILREVLQGIADAEQGIGDRGSPTASQVVHRERHCGEPKHSDPKCAFCQAEGRFDDHLVDKIVRSAPKQKVLAKRSDGIEIRQRTGDHHCICGMSGSLKDLALHLSQHWPNWPKMPPKGFPHREMSSGELAARTRLEREAEQPEWKALRDPEGKQEIDL